LIIIILRLGTGEKYKTKQKKAEEKKQDSSHIKLEQKNFHSTRHTVATLLLANGVPIIDVSVFLGHASVSTTLNLYGHALPENQKEISQKMSTIINNVITPISAKEENPVTIPQVEETGISEVPHLLH